MVDQPESPDILGSLEGDQAKERSRLIAWLLDQGFTADQIRAAGAVPFMLPAKRALRDDDEYTSVREVSEATHIPLELVQRLQGAIGLPRADDPDEPSVLRADAHAVGDANFFIDLGVDAEETVIAMRIIADALGRAASIVREAASRSLLRAGTGEIEIAQAIENLARQAVPRLGPMMEDLLLLKLRHSFESEAVTAAERAAGKVPGAQQITVAFADVAGFTQLGESHPPEELQRLAGRLVKLAMHVAVPPVRLVKSVGDAVMVVSPDPVSLLDAMLNLAEAAVTDRTLPLRIGVASGAAVTRAGDWFGHPINLANRVTAAGLPGEVLVAESTRALVPDGAYFDWSLAGPRRLKGIRDDVTLYWLRRVGS